MQKGNIGWFDESVSRVDQQYVDDTSAFGVYQKHGTKKFDDKFTDLYENYKEAGTDIRRDITMVHDTEFMEQYKQDLLGPVADAFREAYPDDPHVNHFIEQCERMWDTKVRLYNESAATLGFLPISTLEFPVLVKQFFSSVTKDIIDVRAVKSPNISKHIRTTFLVDNESGDEYEYPKCMFDGTWEKIWTAAKGIQLKSDIVPLTNGRLYKYDIIDNLTDDGVTGKDKLSYQIKIDGVKVGTEVIDLPGNGITVEFSTNGTLVNGDLNFTSPGGTKVDDLISGQVNFKDGTVSLTSASGQVTGVRFFGYLSNEGNERTVSVRERRQLLKFTIEDGARWNMPFTMEEIEDAAALLDINYYNRMVDEIVRTQEMVEGMTVIKFLCDEFKKYNGVDTDTYALEPLAMTHKVDLNPPTGFAGDPFAYITKVIQFRMKAIIHQLTEMTKLDGLSFVVVGNPMATQVLSEFTTWKSQNGTNIGGIDVNNSYGFATDMGANIRVVASNLYDAYTVDPVTETNERELVLHIYAYPTSAEHISFQHLKFTSHIMTSQSQTAYASPKTPGGAYNYVTATSRYTNLSVQGISADLILLHSDKIYGKAKTRPPITGAPWYQPTATTPPAVDP